MRISDLKARVVKFRAPKDYHLEYYYRNREKILAQKSEYHRKTREKRLAYMRKYRIEHRAERAEAFRRYRMENPVRLKLARSTYYIRNRDYLLAQRRMRRK